MLRTIVTIYITNFNYDKYLKEAVDSALNQTFSRVEIIILMMALQITQVKY